MTNSLPLVKLHHINDALTTWQLFRNSSDSPERRARILRVADSTMTCGKDRNECELLCVVLAPAPGAFFSHGNEERPTGLTTLTAGKDRQPSGVKKPTGVG
ncbi:hypothetical protein E4W40_22980 [Klebsiella pneumoniae]|nr:hypothetical protein [Klebsiella pneumoniae]MBG8777729.1 hypothetical protein [Klebsiella pneumoniae]